MGVADLHGSVDALLELDLGLLDDAALHADVIGIGRELDRLTVAFSTLLREWEQRGIFERDGSRSAGHRLERELRSSISGRKADVLRARRIGDMPLATKAVLEGRLSLDHLDLLASVNTTERRARFEHDEAVLVRECEKLPYFMGRKVVRHWALRVDEELEAEHRPAGTPEPEPHADAPGDGGEGDGGDSENTTDPGVLGDGPDAGADTVGGDADDEDLPTDERSRLYANRLLDDVLDLRGTLGPIDGTIVERELNRLAEEIRIADKAAGITRTASERRAAALVQMARRSGTAPEDGRRPRSLFTVLIGDQAFRDLCMLSNGIPVSPRQLVPYLTSSMIESILFDGPKTVLTVSSQRTFRGALRRAIEVRDRHCQHPSECEVQAEDCHVDHIVPWAKGGPTSQFNGRLECDVHNVIDRLHDHGADPLPDRKVTPEQAEWLRALWRAQLPPDPTPDGRQRWRIVRLPWIPPDERPGQHN